MTKHSPKRRRSDTASAPTPDSIRSRIVGHAIVAPGDLIPHEANFRRHPPEQMLAMRGSVAELGYVKSVIVSQRTAKILDGHARVEDAIAQGLPGIPVEYVDVTAAEERTILAVLDPISAMADEDPDALAALLQSVAVEDRQLVQFLASLGGEPVAALPEAAPEVEVRAAVADPITERGDLWTLGVHRLLCGDATLPADVARLMDGSPMADVVVTDPPYAIYGSSSGIAADIADDKMVRSFFRDVVKAIAGVLKTHGHFYIACDWRSYPSWWEVMKGSGLTAKNVVVWDKGTQGTGAMFVNAHEWLLFGSLMPRLDNMTQQRTGARVVYDVNVWQIPRVAAAGTEGGREHNAQKPIELVARALRNSSDPGELVVDFFSGSGTTILAAEQEGRRACAMEIDPRYVDVAVRRWEAMTGGTAERVRP